MKYLLAVLFTLSSPTVYSLPLDRELVPVEHVDLIRYQGKWYEIASIPQFFQRKCTKNTTAEYTLLPGNLMKVYNACNTKNNNTISSEGRAKATDNTDAKLNVTFAKLFDKYLFWFSGKYWIIYLEPNYQYAIVGHPTRHYGWILSRTPELSPDTIRELAHFLKVAGYDPCRFYTTPQEGGLQTKKSLCK